MYDTGYSGWRRPSNALPPPLEVGGQLGVRFSELLRREVLSREPRPVQFFIRNRASVVGRQYAPLAAIVSMRKGGEARLCGTRVNDIGT